MKIKPFKIETPKLKARKKPVPPSRVIKDKKQYNRKVKYGLSFLGWGYEL